MMRPLGFGLATVMALSALAVATTAFAKDDTAAEAAAAVAAAKTPCTVTASRFIGQGTMADKSQAKSYEVACQEGLGYALIVKQNSTEPPHAYNCFSTSAPGPDNKPSSLLCKLPANANPQANLQPLMDKTGRLCAIDKARVLGSNAASSFFEVACKDGQGYILISPLTSDGPKPDAASCFALPANGAIQCTLTTAAQRLAIVDALVASSGKACTVKDKRYILTSTAGEAYYEAACTDGKGYIVTSTAVGKFGQVISCAQGANIGGGCTLTDTRQAQTEQNALYSRLAKEGGFDCTVAKYGVFPTKSASDEIVELQCSNRADGGVGFFPASGKPRVLDCLRSQDEGYRCSMTSIEPLYPKLSAQLAARNRGSCVVSGARAFAKTTSSDLIEVACADGAPGWVMEYPTGANQPSELHNCTWAANVGGGCQLPSNMKK